MGMAVNVAKYDRRVSLSKRERHAMLALLRGLRSKQFDRQPRLSMLNRLLEPILDALRITRAEEPTYGTVVRILLREMVRYDSAFWKMEGRRVGWSAPGVDGGFRPRACTRGDTRPQLMAIAILVRGVRDPRRFGNLTGLDWRKKVFGDAPVEASAGRIAGTLKTWGFSSALNDTRQCTALCDALLLNGSPLLEDLTTEVLEVAFNGRTTPERKWSLQRIPRCCTLSG